MSGKQGEKMEDDGCGECENIRVGMSCIKSVGIGVAGRREEEGGSRCSKTKTGIGDVLG